MNKTFRPVFPTYFFSMPHSITPKIQLFLPMWQFNTPYTFGLLITRTWSKNKNFGIITSDDFFYSDDRHFMDDRQLIR